MPPELEPHSVLQNLLAPGLLPHSAFHAVSFLDPRDQLPPDFLDPPLEEPHFLSQASFAPHWDPFDQLLPDCC